MSSSGKKKFLMRHPVVVDLGCSCRRTKLSSLFSSGQQKSSKLKPHSTPKHHHPLSSYYPFSPSATTTTTIATSPWETSRHPSSTSTTTTSFYDEDTSSPSSNHAAAAWSRTKEQPPPKKKQQQQQRRGAKAGRVGESVAVVKESDDPYVDFRESMLQMILEKEIYAWDDLRELLDRFLALNSPYHHDVIVRAFAEIWNGVFSSAAPSSSSVAGACGRQGRPRGHNAGARRRPLHVSRDA
ncbi:hypothetical protein Taro_040953 [Colocasia esculenta]|uniref:Transcription repressor n=1 Tax=Colocasia esculenta TaxID=4460 RepID=A0A843WD45_COLES|nr:hypothetical protein [Colocasia esculenta]